MAHKDASPVSIRVRLKYPDLSTFIEKYAANVSQGGIFIQSRTPQPIGTLLRFEVTLANGQKLLKGEGRVIWVRDYEEATPTQVHGMGVRFVTLDPESEAIVEIVLAHKRDSAARVQRVRSVTQEVQALERTAQSVEEEDLLAEPTRASQPSAQMPAAARPAAALLEQAEQELQQLVLGSSLTDSAIAATLASALNGERPASTQLEELERSLGHLELQPAEGGSVAWQPPPAAPSPPMDEPPPETDQVPVAAPFDPSLLEAAVHVSRATRDDTFDKTFDLSEPTPIGLTDEPFANEKPLLEPGFGEPAPDEGWRRLRTATELLDHSSARVLRDLATKTGGSHGAQKQNEGSGGEAPSLWHEIVGEATAVSEPGLIALTEPAQPPQESPQRWPEASGSAEVDDERTELRESPLLAEDGLLAAEQDLDHKLFEALSAPERTALDDEVSSPEPADEYVPSLDDLAFAAHARSDLAYPEQQTESESDSPDSTDDLQTSNDDPALSTPTHRGGLFGRLFGRRRE